MRSIKATYTLRLSHDALQCGIEYDHLLKAAKTAVLTDWTRTHYTTTLVEGAQISLYVGQGTRSGNFIIRCTGPNTLTVMTLPEVELGV